MILTPVVLLLPPLGGSLKALNRTGGVVVAVVSQDEPQTSSSGAPVDLGGTLSDHLVSRGDFTWRPVPAGDADAGLADGRFAAVVTIGAGFTKSVLDPSGISPATYLSIVSSADEPEIGVRVQAGLKAATDLTLDEVSGLERTGSDPGVDGVLAGMAAKTAEAQQSLATLAEATKGLSSLVAQLGGSSQSPQGKLDAALKAARATQSAAREAGLRAQSVAAAGNSVSSAVAATRNLLVAEMKVQGLSATQRSHILAVYDRIWPSVSSLRSAASAAASSAQVADASASRALSSLQQVSASGSPGKTEEAVRQSLAAAATSVRNATTAMNSVASALGQLSYALGGEEAGQPSFELTSAPVGPADSIRASSMIPATLIALGIGAVLGAVLLSRIGRPLEVSKLTGIPQLPHAGPAALVGALQGALVGALLTVALRPTAAGGGLLIAACVAIAIAIVSASQAAILWAGRWGLALVLVFSCLEWSLLASPAPRATLPPGLNILFGLTPGRYAEDALRYAAFGEPFTAASRLVLPALVLLALLAASMVIAERALNSRRSWAARRLAEAV